jgi:hypothetical protein
MRETRCTNPACGRLRSTNGRKSRNWWQKLWGDGQSEASLQMVGVLLDRSWYCSPACLQPTLSSIVTRSLRQIPPDPGSLRRPRIGTILLDRRLVNQEQLNQALECQRESGGTIGEWLVKLGFVSSRDLTIALSQQLGLPWIDSINNEPSEEALKSVPKRICQSLRLFPIEYNLKTISLVVAVGGPLDMAGMLMLRRMLDCRIHFLVGDDFRIAELIQRYLENRTETDGEEHIDCRESVVTEVVLKRTRLAEVRRMKIDYFLRTFWVRYWDEKDDHYDLFVQVGQSAEGAQSTGQNLPSQLVDVSEKA